MRIISSLALIIITGCSPKPSAPVVSAPAPRLVTVTAPESADADTFVDSILSLTLSDFDSGSDAIDYSALVLSADGTWAANARLNLGVEYFDCKEAGVFSVPSVDSSTVGIVEFTITTTDCPSRESGKSRRVQFSFTDDGNYSVSFR